MRNKVIIAVLVLVVIAGVVMATVFGFNKSFEYGYTNKIFIKFTENFEIADVEEMVKEVFQDAKYKVEYMDEFEDGVIVTTNTASDEQISTFEDKLIEKYEKFTDKNSGFMEVIHVPPVRTIDLVKVFVKPVIIVTAIVVIFLAIVFRKLGFVKAVCLPIALILGINAIYVSLIAIFRIPVSDYIVSLTMFVYVLSLIVATAYTKRLAK